MRDALGQRRLLARALARRIRATTASGTETPGTSLARNSALRSETSGQIPAMIGMRNCSTALEEPLELVGVEDRLRDRELGARRRPSRRSA